MSGTPPIESLVPPIEGIPLWNERWPPETLQPKFADMGESAARRAFNLQPVANGDVLFPSAIVDRALDRSFSVIDAIEATSRFGAMRIVAGLDLAAGTSDRSAFWALVVVAVDRDAEHRYVVRLERHKGLSLLQQVDLVRQVFDETGFEVLAVETNNIQSTLAEHFADHVPVKPLFTSSKKHSESLGVPSMGAEFEQGRWHIPWGDSRSKRTMEPLVAELKSYPSGRHTDTVMALYFARQMVLQKKRPAPRFAVLH